MGTNANLPALKALMLTLAAVGLMAGMATQMQGAQLLSAPVPEMLCAVALLMAVSVTMWAATWPTPNTSGHGAWLAVASVALSCWVLGYASTDWRARLRLAQALPIALEGQDLVLEGHVASLPQLSPSGTRFVLEVASAHHRGQAVEVPSRVRLAWYAGFDADGLLGAANEPLRAGQRWRLTVRLRQPHGSLNPHGFDHELWLFEQGLRATGYVRALPGAANAKLADDVAAPVERVRQRVRDAIYAQVSDGTAAGVLAALAIGDQGAIERDDWEIFRATGVAHLMSISGLHVTMFAWLAGLAVGWLWRRSSRLMLLMPTPTAARWGGLLLATGYAVVAGWGVPAQRTVWMLAVVVLLRGSGLRWPSLAVLLAAALVVCLIDPWALLQVGFWLSFMAVAMLMVSDAGEPVTAEPRVEASAWCRRAKAAAAGALRTQAVATAGLAPLSMVFFQQISLVGFGANLLAIPLVTLAITPLALLGAVLPWLWSVAAWMVQGMMLLLGAVAQLPWASWSAGVAPPWAALAGLLGGVLVVAPLPWRLRLLGVPLMLPLLLPAIARPPEGRFEVVALDVGQGTAVLVRTRQHLLVYDAGPRWGADSDAGQRLLLPLLRARGETRIDVLMLSHRDSDHVGGAAALLGHARVAALHSSLEPGHELLALSAKKQVPHHTCAAGQSWVWDGVRFEVLHPLADAVLPGIKPNHLSCVLRIQEAGTQGQAGRSLLLSGDIEAPQEAALLQRHAERGLASDVLLVPHHGSRTSSTAGFIEAVQPRTAVVQAAYRSRFGHPAPDVVQRYEARGIEVVRTDRCGAWLWKADGTQECTRAAMARYWHHRAGPIPAPGAGCAEGFALSLPSRSPPCPSTLR